MKKISRRNFLLASGVVTVGAALAACGGGSSSSTAASSAAPASSAAASAPAAAEGKVLNIWCWNDEFQSRFNDYYPEVKEIAADKSTTTLKDGTTVKWTINANENNNYQNKLDEALLNQDSAADDDKIDIFLIEADYALKYVDSDYVLDVKKDIGLTDSDLAGQYQYTKDIVSVDGSQRGTTWQATPGLFAYRRSIAKEVLGTDDPAEVQTYLSDWDKFNDVAAKAAAKGYKMLSGFDDAYRTFSNNVSAPWVTGTTVTVDENLMKWVDQTKEYTDKGYNNKSSLWDSQWASDQGPTGKVFGFFYSTWGINFTLLGNSLATPTAEGGKEEVGNGIYGDYAVCEGPQPYYWGGTWICGAAGSDNLENFILQPFGQWLQNKNPCVYIASYIFSSALCGSLWSCVGLAVSAFYPDRKVALASPFIINILLYNMAYISTGPWHSPSDVAKYISQANDAMTFLCMAGYFVLLHVVVHRIFRFKMRWRFIHA